VQLLQRLDDLLHINQQQQHQQPVRALHCCQAVKDVLRLQQVVPAKNTCVAVLVAYCRFLMACIHQLLQLSA
jgi:hypothetical protein